MRILRLTLRFLVYTLLLVLVLAVGAVLALTLPERGRDLLASLISDFASSPDQAITVAEIDGIWSGNLRVGDVVIADRRGAWLALRGVELDWSPLALLSGDFHAERAAAARVELARLPEPGPEQPQQQDGQGGGLPVDIAVERLELPDVALGREVAGEAARLAGTGSLTVQADPMVIDTDLDLRRIDGRPGTLQAAVGYVPAENRLQLDINAAEPRGGVLAGLLRLPGEPAVNLLVSGDGPLADWSGSGSLALDGAVVAQLSGSHRVTPAGRAIDAAGSGRFASLLPPSLQALFAGDTRFEMAATLGGNGALQLGAASLESDAVRLTGSGRLQLPSTGKTDRLQNGNGPASNDLTVDLAAKEAAGVAIAMGGAELVLRSAQLRATGPGSAPAVDLAASVAELALVPATGTSDPAAVRRARDVTLRLSSPGFDLGALSGPFSAAVTAASVDPGDPRLQPLVAGEVAISATGTASRALVTIEEGSLRSDALTAGLSGTVRPGDGSLDIRLDADVATAALPPAVPRAPLGERLALAGRLVRGADGTLAAEDISASSGGLAAQGRAALSGETIEAALSGSLAEIGTLAPGASGALAFEVTASGALRSPEVALEATSPRLTAAGREITELRLAVEGRADLAEPAAQVRLNGLVGGEALAAGARLSSEAGVQRLQELSLTLGPNRIEGGLELAQSGTGGAVPEGTLTLNLPDLAPLAALAGQQAAGDLQGTAVFARTGDGLPRLTLEATSATITRGEIAVQGAAVSAVVDNYLAAPAVSGRVRAASVQAGGTTVADADIDLAQEGGWTRFDGGASVNGTPAQAAGRVRFAGGTTTLELASASATLRGVALSLAEPATVSAVGQDVTAEGLALAVNGAPALRLSASHRLTDGSRAITAAGEIIGGGEGGADAGPDGAAVLAGLVPEPLRPLLAAPGRFDVALQLGVDGRLTVERGLVDTGALTANAAGSLALPRLTGGAQTAEGSDAGQAPGTEAGGGEPPDGPPSNDFTVDLRAKDPAGTRIALPAGSDRAELVLRSAQLRAAGPGSTPALEVTASLAEVALAPAAGLAGAPTRRAGDLTLTLSSSAFDLAAVSGPFTAELKAATVESGIAQLQPLLAGPVTVSAAGTASRDLITIEQGALRSASLSASLTGTIRPEGGVFDLSLSADVATSALPGAIPRAPLAERLTLSGRVARTADGGVTADDLSLQSGGLSATGNARLAGGTVEASLSGSLSEVGTLAQGASGAISFSLSATGPQSAPSFSAEVASDRFVAAGREITDLRLTASGVVDPANPAAELSLAGAVGGQPLAGSARLASTEAGSRLEELALSLGPNQISGSLQLDEAFIPEGMIDIDLPDVGPLAALAFQQAEGSVQGSLNFTRQDGVPHLALEARSDRIAAAGQAASGVAVEASVSNYLAAPVVTGRVRAAEVQAGNARIANADVTLQPEGAFTRFDGSATVNGTPAAAAGRVRLAGGQTTLELERASATVQGMEVQIGEATSLDISDGQVRLDNLAIDLGGGEVRVSGTAGANLDLQVTVANLPAAALNQFVPGLDAAGMISGSADVSGSAGDPTAQFDVNWNAAQVSQTRAAGLGPVDIAASGRFEAGRVRFDTTLGGGGLSLRGGGTVDTRGSRALDLRFTGGVPFDFLSERLAAQGLTLSGGVDVDITVGGTISAPVIGGRVIASGARLVHAASGIALDNVAADVSLGQGRATIQRLSATLSSGGSVSATGSVGLADGFPADIAVRLEGARYADGRVVTTTMDGALALRGALAAAPALTGTIDLRKTVITVPERLPGSLAELDVQHRRAPADVRAQAAELKPADPASGGGGGLTLDITVNAPQQIFVRGRGLDAELGGSLRLTGPASAPQAVGDFRLERGRLAILGRRLSFTSGSLTFAGSLVPYIDLVAESAATDATVTISVTGPANNPRFDFSSIPELPEDEVLARLIFGRSMSNLSPLQIAQLAEAAAMLAGVGGNTTLLESLRSSLGVDDLDVQTDDAGQTSVSVGKYLNDRTYVTVEGGGEGGGRATINLDIGRGFTLRGEASGSGEAKGGVFYEQEY